MRKSAKRKSVRFPTLPACPPQWLQESMNQAMCAPENFRMRREHMLKMSVEQCAAWLRTHRTTVARWEAGTTGIPFAAYEAMRLLSENVTFSRRNDKWDGWLFNKVGELVSPDGTLIFTPERLLAVASAFGLAAVHEINNNKLKNELTEASEEIERLRVENIQLRQMAAADVMVDELHSIRDHVESLLALVDRATVYQFPETRKAAA